MMGLFAWSYDGFLPFSCFAVSGGSDAVTHMALADFLKIDFNTV